MGVFVEVHHTEVIKGKPYAEGRKILQCNTLGDEATFGWPPAVRLFATLLPNTRRAARSSPPFLFHFPASSPKAYWHFGSPSLPAGASDVDPMKMEQVLVVLTLVMLAVQPSAVVLMTGSVLPVDWLKVTPPASIVEEYLTESAKYASSAVTRLRRSDFIEARYAFSFVLANFGIAIAARMPMITTTMSSSISVKPLRFICASPCCCVMMANTGTWSYGIIHHAPRKQAVCPPLRRTGQPHVPQ